MAESSPADIAVTFRSIARRLNEALAPVNGDTSAVGGLPAELERVIDSAATIVGVDASANDIADAVVARHADQWSGDQLGQLRSLALEVGRLLRSIAAAAEAQAAERENS